jgi:hypothetical protein
MKNKNTRDAAVSKMIFFLPRQRQGDVHRIAEKTGYSISHVRNVIAGRRNVPEIMANEMYNISRRRQVI